jgi:transcriptional regulator with XRE-family HTH domain
VKKINRVLSENTTQYSLLNNLRVVRESKGVTQREVCKRMKKYDRAFDKSLLSKMENGVCLPTYYQLSKLAEILACTPSELIAAELYY